MDRAISIRLDDEAQEALRLLTDAGLSRSAAIRAAIIELAERRGRRALEAEAQRLGADPADRAEMAVVAQLMESLRAAR